MAVNRDAWLAALGTVVPAEDPDALSTFELSQIFDLKMTTTKNRIRRLVASGGATVTRKRVTDALGRVQLVTAYKLVTPEPEPRRRRR